MLHSSNKGLIIEIFAVMFVLLGGLILLTVTKIPFISSSENIVKVTRFLEANTKLHSILDSKYNGYPIMYLIGKAAVLGEEKINLADGTSLDLKDHLKMQIEILEKESFKEKYYFYVMFDGKKFFEIKSSTDLDTSSLTSPSTIYVPVLFTEKNLMLSASLIE